MHWKNSIKVVSAGQKLLYTIILCYTYNGCRVCSYHFSANMIEATFYLISLLFGAKHRSLTMYTKLHC